MKGFTKGFSIVAILVFVGLIVWQVASNRVYPGLGLMRIRPVVAAADANAKPFLDPAGNQVWLGSQRLFALSRLNSTFDESGQPAIGYSVASYDSKNLKAYLQELDGQPFAVLHNSQVICLSSPEAFSTSSILKGGEVAWTEQQAEDFLAGLTNGLHKTGSDEEPVGAIQVFAVDLSFEEFLESEDELAFASDIEMELIPLRKIWLEDDYSEGLLIKFEPTTDGLKKLLDASSSGGMRSVVISSSLVQWYLPARTYLREIALEVDGVLEMPPTRAGVFLMRGMVTAGQSIRD